MRKLVKRQQGGHRGLKGLRISMVFSSSGLRCREELARRVGKGFALGVASEPGSEESDRLRELTGVGFEPTASGYSTWFTVVHAAVGIGPWKPTEDNT
jgi:hypothetical protein